MTVKILFFKSSSKYYDIVCLLCKDLGSYTQEKSTNIWILDLGEIRLKRKETKEILGIIRTWKKNEYYIDDEKVSLHDIDMLMNVLDCEKKCHECSVNDEYCYGETGWGCRFINSITLRQELVFPYHSKAPWYDYGDLVNGEWIIDKDRMISILIEEIRLKHTDICVCFSLARFAKSINELPNRIIVSENHRWVYKYRKAPLTMNQTEIIGIEPRQKQPIYFYDIDIPTYKNYKDLIHDLEKNSLVEEPLEDNEQIENLIHLLKAITNGDLNIQKGQLSCFSSLMEKNPWFSSMIAAIFLSWLIS